MYYHNYATDIYEYDRMKHRRPLHLNAWNVYNKRRSIEIFNRQNEFTDMNEFMQYVEVHKPFDKKRQHKKKTIKNENAYYIDTETDAKKKVETFEHFRLMVLQGWNNMAEEHKAAYGRIALEMNRKSEEEMVDDCLLNRRCKEEIDKRFKSDLLVLQYQAQQLQKGIEAMITQNR